MQSTAVMNRQTSSEVFEVSRIEGETDFFAKAVVGARVWLVSTDKGAYL
jgi:hypothetical protein